MFENVPNRRDEKLCSELKEKTCEMMRVTSRVTVRAHHILCHFCGYERVQYPDTLRPKITEEMKTNPSLEIRVVGGLDDLCYCCPVCLNNRCVGDDGKMFPADMEKDRDVLRRLRLVSGAVLPARELFGMVAEKIPHVDVICADNKVDENGNLFTTCSPMSGYYEKAVAERFWE